MKLDYDVFKQFVIIEKKLLHQHLPAVVIDEKKYYYLFAYDGNALYDCNINEIEHSNSVSDYETNYSATANKVYGLNTVVKKNPIQYHIEETEKELSCSYEDWTVFWNKEFTEKVEFDEIVLSLDNDHYLKIEIGNESDGYSEIFNTALINLKNIIGCCHDFSKNISMSNNHKSYKINLEGNKNTNIRISQKRRDKKTDKVLNIFGYILSYRGISQWK